MHMNFTAILSFIDGRVIRGDSNAEFDFIVPAFVDIHCHGGGGSYFYENAEIAIQTHYSFGTRIQLASLVSKDIDTLIRQVSYLKSKDLFGIHLEGPYISQKYCGAHNPAFLKAPDLNELQALIDASENKIKMITLAPELPNAIEAIRYLVSKEIIVAIGHSDANAEVTYRAIEAGAKVVTHFNNAMSKIPAKDCLSEIALNSDLNLEMIFDGQHVSNEDMKSIIGKAPNRIIAVTDAMAAAGAGDGDYLIGDLSVSVQQGVARLKDSGALAGSTLTMLAAFLNLKDLAGFERAVQYTSLNPAKLLGIDPYTSYIGIKGRSVTYL